MTHTYIHNTWEMGARGKEVENHPLLHTEFEGNLGYMGFCLKTIKMK